MPDIFTEKIKFPEEIDVFPTLGDNSGSAIEEYQVVYAEHQNKLINLIHKLQPLILTSGTASGNRTLYGLGYTFTLSATVSQIFELFGGPAASSSSLNQPGNVLPFEAVITTSSDTYYHNTGRTPDNVLLFKLSDSQELYNKVGGGLNPFTSKPIVTATLSATDNLGYADGGLDDFIVNAYVCTSPNTMIVRGSILDVGMGSTVNQTNSERWLSSRGSLHVTISGVSV